MSASDLDKTPVVGLVVPLQSAPGPADQIDSVGSSRVLIQPNADANTTNFSNNFLNVIMLESGPRFAACAPFAEVKKKKGVDFGATADNALVGLMLRYDWRRKDEPAVPAGATLYVAATCRGADWARQIYYLEGDEKKQCPFVLVPADSVVLAPQVPRYSYVPSYPQVVTNPAWSPPPYENTWKSP